MKKTAFLYIVALFLLSCSAGKETAMTSENTSVASPCPPQTDCTIEVLKDKSLDVKTDDTGHTYYNLQDTPGKTVLKYSYRKITDPKLQDAGYSETIIFETDGTTTNLNYSGKDIKKTKMVFNVACFCRGKAGVYKVEEGTISYKDNKLHIEIPQLVDGQATRVVDVVVK
jgi:hypothetical protein